MNFGRIARLLFNIGGFTIGGIMGLATVLELPDDIRTIQRHLDKCKRKKYIDR